MGMEPSRRRWSGPARSSTLVLMLVAVSTSLSSAVVPLHSRINSVEHGLLPAIHFDGTPQAFSMTERMDHFGVPGASVAVIRDWKID
jgi:hypothetical protein